MQAGQRVSIKQESSVVVSEGVGLIETTIFFGDHFPKVEVVFGAAHFACPTTARVGQGEKIEKPMVYQP